MARIAQASPTRLNEVWDESERTGEPGAPKSRTRSRSG